MIETLPETGSTNHVLAQRIAADEPMIEGFWLRAERQTAGRGRSGRQWESGAGNLYCSTVVNLQPDDPAAHTLSLVAGLAVHDLLEMELAHTSFDRQQARWLKWPNDLLCNGAKIAGILCERVKSTVVVGIGINVDRAPEFPDRSTTSIRQQGGGTSSPASQVLEHLVPLFADRLEKWRSDPLPETLAAWEARAHALGTALKVSDGDRFLEGSFAGLCSDGALRLRLLDGSHRTIHAGDVELEA